MKLKTLLVTILVLIFVKCSDQAVKFLNCVILIDPMKIIVSKVEETHNKYMLDFKHSLRITQNFTNYISINLTLLVKIDSLYFHYSVDLPNASGKMNPLKIVVSKVEETHNEYMLDFKHSLRITQNFTNYISINVSLFVKLDSTYLIED
ncbi:CLUMA_CG001227, isoform A [Clunio marinus]|uniref:CLUMA_CG001227, isoform A n=1 Tax=Clunio marinus TaxID=568069 RepID=A0A1J1HMG5_9DIPT|nr:CLUMA_CG001227, isoform A [Clunio marinus]